ncbi:MAG: tRNA-dihydrouridine synthase family protein [Eubacteriales bacterium]|nr:tRNA-dihydrouridine synthase family protein [Eubacteriales bacterium]
MRIYAAPMEGITGFAFRRQHALLFGGIDKYYMPFITVNQNYKFKNKELREVDPENNRGLTAVPQLMTNKPEHFLWAAEQLTEMGYREINLNLGCPAAQEVTRHRGAGQLSDPDSLDRFLEGIFEGVQDPEKAPGLSELQISVKTRLGMEDPEEFAHLLDIYNRYPISELTVHPRVRTEFYRGKVHMETFAMCAENSKNPLVYNGDIRTVDDFRKIVDNYPNLSGIMLGRGLLADPALAEACRESSEEKTGRSGMYASPEELKVFHDALYQEYCGYMNGEQSARFHMLELWAFWGSRIEDFEKPLKKLRKAKNRAEYLTAVDNAIRAMQ